MTTILTVDPKPPIQMGPRIDVTKAAFKANPFPFYARLRTEQPVYPARLGRQNAWLVTRYDDVLALLKDERFAKNPAIARSSSQAANEPWVPAFVKPLQRNMLDLDEPDHARLRGLVHKAFTPGRIEQLRGRIQTVADQLLDATQDKAPVDLLHSFALPLPLIVISELLGIPTADRHRFHRWTKAIVKTPSPLNILLAMPSIAAFMRYLRQLLAQRRIDPRDDLLTALVQAEEAGDHLSEDELLAMAFLLLIAGHETTVNLIASGTLALLQHPDQFDLLRRHPDLIRPAVEELLRFTSPVEQATERYAREEVSLHGVTIPRGALTLAVLASANRDEHIFERPDELDLTRDKNRHLAFGHGIHFCLGAPLARLEGQIAINTLVQRFPNLRLAVAPDQLRWRATPTVRGLEKLPVIW
ncbi:MAG: cytochrome P450 [Chloroflexi bacterium]|nr:cytochrome P450 [Chloroflexota bacterium]